jgi:hypothetical protein
MEQIDGEEDSVLTWGDLYVRRNELRNAACEGSLNVQKSADAIVRRVLQHLAEGLNMK